MIEKQNQGLALFCDLQGLILRVLRNDLHLAKAVPGLLFFDVIEGASHAKALNFLTEIKSQGAVLDWELNIPTDGGITTLHFAGGVADYSLLITAAGNSQLAEWFYDDMLRINNEQTNMLRAVLKDKQESSRNIPDSIYDEISRLNNELMTMQRELAGKNAELAQRIEERTSELREAQEKLIRHERLVVLGQMAGSVGHELRNPLTVIKSAVYYLKLVQPDADEKVKEYLERIEGETSTAEKIITDLLDFARIKSVDAEVISVSKLAESVLKRYPIPTAVRLTLEIPENLPMLQVDPRQMEQVLGNLIINACQAMSAGGELAITAHQEQEMIAIAVKDSGVGIPPENMEKIFEPLFTTKAKGIGLGLAVSQKLVEANSGRLEVQSEAGKGSTFTVYLPMKAEAHPV